MGNQSGLAQPCSFAHAFLNFIQKWVGKNVISLSPNVEQVTLAFKDLITQLKQDPSIENHKLIKECQEYKRIAFHDEKFIQRMHRKMIIIYADEYVSGAYKKNHPSKITIHAKIFMDEELLPWVLISELIFQIIKPYFLNVDYRFTRDLAFSLTYDIIQDKIVAKKYVSFWKEEFKPIQEHKYVTYDLFHYATSLKSYKGGYFFLQFFEQLVINTKNKGSISLDCSFPFNIIPTLLAIFSAQHLQVLAEITMKPQNKIDPKEIASKLSFSLKRVKQIIKELQSTFILRKKVQYKPASIGLLTFHGLFFTPYGEGKKFQDIKYSMTRSVNIFRGSEEIIFWSGYLPNTAYAKRKFHEWRNNLNKPVDLAGKKEERITLTKYPLIGIEDQDFRFELIRPELYDYDLKTWKFGETLSLEEIKERNAFPVEAPLLTWEKWRCEIIKEMIKQPFSKRKTKIVNAVPGKTKPKLDFMNMLISDRIIQEINVTPFYFDLLRIMVAIKVNKKQYLEYITQFASQAPISLNIFIPEPGFSISFLGLPVYKSDYFILDLQTKFQSIISVFPSNIETSLPFELKCEDKSWRFSAFPKMNLYYTSRKTIF